MYFGLRDKLGTETVSWLCVLAAAPFAVMAFFKYNGMTAEQFAWAFIKSEIIMPHKYPFKAQNLYYEIYEKSKGSDKHDKNNDIPPAS